MRKKRDKKYNANKVGLQFFLDPVVINKTMSMMRSALFRLRVGNQKKKPST